MKVNELKEEELYKCMLTLLEYYLDVKVIILPDKSTSSAPSHFSIYGALNNTEKIKIDKNPLFDAYDPKHILYVAKENDAFVFVAMKTLDSLNEIEVEHLKTAFQKMDHEFVVETQLQSIKNVIS